MLKISLDEAYVFDMLSVFDVKIQNLNGDKLTVTLNKKEEMVSEIIDQLGIELYNSIIESDEYSDMINANKLVFRLIDESKNDNGLAKVTDNANYQRHIKKIALQNKFFDTNLTEVKNRL